MKPLSEWTTAELVAERDYFRRHLNDCYREEPDQMHIAFAASILVRPDGTSETETYTIGALEAELRRRKKAGA